MTRYWHWGTKAALIYGLFATGTLTMVGIAINQRTDLVTPDYYARALRQDERMAATANAQALGAGFSAELDGDGTLHVHWPHAPEAGTITLYRPANADLDRSVDITSPAQGNSHHQRVPLAGMSSGVWRVQVAWTAGGGQPYYAEREVIIR